MAKEAQGGGVVSIESRLSRVEALVASLAETVERSIQAQERLAKIVQQRSATNWAAVAPALTLLLFLIAGGMYMHSQADAHALIDGHPPMVQRVFALEQQQKSDHGEVAAQIRDIEQGSIIRSQDRFTKSDYDLYILPVLDEARQRLRDLEKVVGCNEKSNP